MVCFNLKKKRKKKASTEQHVLEKSKLSSFFLNLILQMFGRRTGDHCAIYEAFVFLACTFDFMRVERRHSFVAMHA